MSTPLTFEEFIARPDPTFIYVETVPANTVIRYISKIKSPELFQIFVRYVKDGSKTYYDLITATHLHLNPNDEKSWITGFIDRATPEGEIFLKRLDNSEEILSNLLKDTDKVIGHVNGSFWMVTAYYEQPIMRRDDSTCFFAIRMIKRIAPLIAELNASYCAYAKSHTHTNESTYTNQA